MQCKPKKSQRKKIGKINISKLSDLNEEDNLLNQMQEAMSNDVRKGLLALNKY